MVAEYRGTTVSPTRQEHGYNQRKAVPKWECSDVGIVGGL